MTSDEVLDTWLDEWEELVEQGKQPSVDEFLAGKIASEKRELGNEFRRRVLALGWVADRLMPVRYASVQPTQTELAPGTMLDQFRILGQLGRGGMGVVYEAEDTLLRRRVAIKMLPRSADERDPELVRLLKEARSVAKLNHPNVVAIYHVGRTAGGYYLVLELVAGGSLQTLIKDGIPIPWKDATRAIADACRGLMAAHGVGLVHRDIKPSNLLRNESGLVKVADFGLARGGDVSATSLGQVTGTPQFMSPEQCRGKPGDVRSDIYALGATYFNLLTGHSPYTADSAVQVMFAHCHSPIPDPRRIVPDLPTECTLIIRKSMAKDPVDRYQSAEQLLDALTGLLDRCSDRHELLWNPLISPPLDLGPTNPETLELPRPNDVECLDSLRIVDLPPQKVVNSIDPLRVKRRSDLRSLSNLISVKQRSRRLLIIIAICLTLSILVFLGISIRDRLSSMRPGGGALPARPGETRPVEIAPGVSMIFCWVPAGGCQLGSPKAERNEVIKELKEKNEPDWLQDEADGYRGTFNTDGFWLGKYEVTQFEWTAVMKGVVFKGVDLGTPSHFSMGRGGIAKRLDTSRFPVESVSWEQCQEFLKRANAHGGILRAFDKPGRFALPHEDQWEYACRGGFGNYRPFYWGNSLNLSQANCGGRYPFATMEKGRYLARTCAVDDTNDGGYPVHPWGLCHMHGNVWEWCENSYGKTTDRVVRGGSWYSYGHYCRAAIRNWNAPSFSQNSIGCRLILSLD